MAAWPVVLRMYVDDRRYAKKIEAAVKNLRGTYGYILGISILTLE
jgi:hypothetical protein